MRKVWKHRFPIVIIGWQDPRSPVWLRVLRLNVFVMPDPCPDDHIIDRNKQDLAEPVYIIQAWQRFPGKPCINRLKGTEVQLLLDHFDRQATRGADLFHLLPGFYSVDTCMLWIYVGKSPCPVCRSPHHCIIPSQISFRGLRKGNSSMGYLNCYAKGSLTWL